MSPTVVLPVELQKDVSVIDFELPSEEEIRSVLLGMIEANRQTGRVQFDLQPDEEEQLIQAALGLTLHEAENAFARAMVGDGRLDSSDIEVVLEEKRQVIKKTGILEFIHATEGLDAIGGLDNLKDWLTKRERAWLESARRYNLPPPRGLLITGVPGCGKSLTAKCASALWQFPLLRLDIGRVFGGLVGSSEQNMRAAIRTAEAIAPSVLWIDEIEKGFSGSTTGASHDSGTSSRVFGTFLTWMQEKNRPVFVMATANAIDVLPPEFLRKGRFDEIFFVDLPNAEERAEIFDVHLRKRLTDREVVGDFEITRDVLIALAELADGYNGAEIEQSVIDGLREAHYEEERAVRLSDFQRSIQAMVPLSVTQAEQIHMTREWAKQRAVPATTSTDEATAHDVRVEAPS
jgi:SpoVK/Ycf46/Vps4 family AAA+-type ATPase